MDRNAFVTAYLEQETAIERIAQRAGECHRQVNQYYNHFLPYEFHLRLVASYVTRYGHLLDITTDQLQTIYAAAYYHDSIEDARLSFHDVEEEFAQLNAQGCQIDIPTAAEAVYALTNEKGRTREERANERYYEGIRQTRYAPFLKLCDRLGNLHASTLFGVQQRMTAVYEKEFPDFIAHLGNVPQEMVERARQFFHEGIRRS